MDVLKRIAVDDVARGVICYQEHFSLLLSNRPIKLVHGITPDGGAHPCSSV